MLLTLWLTLILLSPLSLAQKDPAITETETQTKDDNPSQEIVKRQTLAEIQANRKALLESEYPPESIKHIGSGDTAFIGLYEKDNTGNPYGAVLIVHGEGQTADFPHTISAIRHELPQDGWTSLSITLPEQSKPAVPPRPITDTPKTLAVDSEMNTEGDKVDTKNDEGKDDTITAQAEAITDKNDKNQDNEQLKNQEKFELKTPKEVEAIALARLTAAISLLNDEGQFNIVIVAHGTSALRAMSYLVEAAATPPSAMKKNVSKNTKIKIQRSIRAIVFLNARNHILGIDTPLTNFLNISDLPVLDIYFDEHYLDDTEAALRKKSAKNNNMSTYISVKLLAPSSTIFDDENRFTRRVRGFLRQYARGVEVE